MIRLLPILLLFAGCVSIDGGAVEISWVVRTSDGRAINDCGCTCPSIAKMRLKLDPVAGGPDPCAARETCEFSCGHKSGATLFDIPPATYSISLVPIGAEGEVLPGGDTLSCSAKSSVSPLVRVVDRGRVTQIDAILIQAGCAESCGGADSTKVCAR
jgi:hypothetical protein